MRIALIGGSGFIGGWLARCARPGDELVVVDRLPPPDDVARRVEYRPADLATDDIAGVVKGVDGLVLLASARVGLDHRRETLERYLPSLELADRAFEACRRAGVANVVHLSSIAVYGSANPRPWSESAVPRPETCYGVMKASVELLGDFYARRREVRVKSLRVAQVVGAGERPGFMLAIFIDRARRREPLEVHGAGRGRREYVYVRDVAGAVFAALARPGLDGVFNIGTGVNTSHRELAELVNEAFGNRGNIVLRPDRPEDDSAHLMDVGRAESGLGWRARWSLNAALEELARDPAGDGE